MASRNLFRSLVGKLVPATTVTNETGGAAYERTPKQALAQYVATGCLNATYYASADDQLQNVLALASKVDSEFLARLAVFARENAWMKDAPALLCAILSTRSPEHLAKAFPRVVDNGKFEAFKSAGPKESRQVPDVPFEMLTALSLGRDEWVAIARKASWQVTRMNLNTFARRGAFEVAGLADLVASRLADPKEVAKARAFPYQLLAAHSSVGEGVPPVVRDALQDAMEIAIANVPRIEGRVFVCPDVSGSMASPVTGYRKGATTAIRCIDVAALVAAAIVRANPKAEVIPFEEKVVPVDLNPRDSVMTNAKNLASVGGGGTNCSAALEALNERKAKGDLVVFVSDNESRADPKTGRGTALMAEWSRFRSRNAGARLACIDLQPSATTQAAESDDVLNVGGFSDEVFDVLSAFAAGSLAADHWVGRVEEVVL